MRTEVIVDPGGTRRSPSACVACRSSTATVEAATDGGRLRARRRHWTSTAAQSCRGTRRVEHEIELDAIDLLPVPAGVERPFLLPAGDDVEVLRDRRGDVVGRAVRRPRRSTASSASRRAGPTDPVALREGGRRRREHTTWAEPEADRDAAMRRSWSPCTRCWRSTTVRSSRCSSRRAFAEPPSPGAPTTAPSRC